ncbi:unnamed protein product [Penicillium olsonii]|nr:unnamed protein product [Penicillium olsonii]
MDHRDFLLDDLGRRIQSSTIIHLGEYALVVRRFDTAIKMPVVHTYDADTSINVCRAQLRQEQRIYRCLQPDLRQEIQGVVPCTAVWGNTIELQYMSQGTLGQMLESRGVPSLPLQRRWLYQLAIGLDSIHSRRILHNDIAPRNLLLDDSLNIKFTDFGVSSIVPKNEDMHDFMDGYNCSMWTDLIQLGSVFYAILGGQRSVVNIYPNHGAFAEYPPLDTLPDVSHMWAAGVIEDCWNPRELHGGAREVVQRIKNVVSYYEDLEAGRTNLGMKRPR